MGRCMEVEVVCGSANAGDDGTSDDDSGCGCGGIDGGCSIVRIAFVNTQSNVKCSFTV